jgi:hypothetical protein
MGLGGNCPPLAYLKTVPEYMPNKSGATALQ